MVTGRNGGVWCVQKNVIQQQDIIDELRTLLSNGALVPAGYKIEEYLAAQQQKQECLRAVLHSHNQVKEIHYHLARIPFRGYITTSYDTCIETAYTEIQHNQLRKFYKTSLSKTIEACRNKRCHTEFCVVCPLTDERVARKGPLGEQCEGEVACVKERHSLGCEAHRQCTEVFEPKRRPGLPLRPMPTRETYV